MQQTLHAPPGPLDHLCCGTAGRADIALTVGLATRTAPWVSAGLAAARTVAARVVEQGELGLRGQGFQWGLPEPGVFQGVAGIGYQMLRASAPERLPSLLALDAPGPGAAEERIP